MTPPQRLPPRRVAIGALLVTAAACVLAWALAYPATSLSAALTRALADGAATVTLGLAALPALDTGRHRDELIRRAAGPLVAASAVWMVAELVRSVFAAADAAGTDVAHLGLRTAGAFVLDTAPGRAGLLTVAAAGAVCALAALGPRSATAAVTATGVAAVGIVGHPLTGHLADDPWGGAAIAVHALAAALWCGALAAVVLTVDHRGQWARVLPRFSQLSLYCVATLVAGGVLAAAVRIDAPSALLLTGYGRVLTAKVVLTAVLVALAWRNRATWLPAARTHRSTAVMSRSRAVTELALMATALAAAGVLAVTG